MRCLSAIRRVTLYLTHRYVGAPPDLPEFAELLHRVFALVRESHLKLNPAVCHFSSHTVLF